MGTQGERPTAITVVQAFVLVSLIALTGATSAEAQCETEPDGCLPWGETVIGQIGATPTRVVELSGDGQTALLEIQNGPTPTAASWRLDTDVRLLNPGTLAGNFDQLTFTDINDSGTCGTGFYRTAPIVNFRGFLFERINGTVTITRRSDRLPTPTGNREGWDLRGAITLGITDSCDRQVGASQAEPAFTGDEDPIWGRIGMVWADTFPYDNNLPPVGTPPVPNFLFQLDDAATQGDTWPSYYSQANEISTDGQWIAGFSVSSSISGPPFVVQPFPAVWNLFSGSPVRTDWPVFLNGQATDIEGDALGFTSVGFTDLGVSVEAWRAEGPLITTLEPLGNADPGLATSISIADDRTAIVPRENDIDVDFYPTSGPSFSSSGRLGLLGLDPTFDVFPDATSSDRHIWGGNLGNDAFIVNVTPLKVAFMGDSYGSGEGARDPGVPLTQAYETGTAVRIASPSGPTGNICHRSFQAQSYRTRPPGSTNTFQLIDGAVPGFEWHFVSCSGAESKHFFNQVQGFPPDDTPAYQAPDGILQATQVPTDVDAIFVSIGGNDSGFAPIAISCIVWNCLQIDPETGDSVIDRARAKILNEVKSNLEATYDQLLSTFPNAEIFATGYPLILDAKPCPQSAFIVGVMEFTQFEASAVRETAGVLNAVIRDTALAKGVHFVPIAKRFSNHNICGPEPWLNGINTFLSLTQKLGNQESSEQFHPNVAGAQAYADAISDYLRDKTPARRNGLPTARLP